MDPQHQVEDLMPGKQTAVKLNNDKGLLIFSVDGCQIPCIGTISSLVPDFPSVMHSSFPFTKAPRWNNVGYTGRQEYTKFLFEGQCMNI